MLFGLFNVRKAVEAGAALADQFVLAQSPSAPAVPRQNGTSGKDAKQIQALLHQIDREIRPLQLGLYGRTRLAHSFKWRLLEKGVRPESADQLTQMLVLRLSTDEAPAAPLDGPATFPARRASPRKIEGLLRQADGYFSRGAYPEAANALTEAIELNPRNAEARNSLGATLCRLGRYAEAEEQFRRATNLKPNSPDAHSNLGTVLLLRGQLTAAETPLRRALKLSPKKIAAQISLGRTLFVLGRVEEAKDAYGKALKAAPANTYALEGLGHIAAAEGHFSEAEGLFKQALALEPKLPGAWAALAGLRHMTPADKAWVATAEEIAESGLPAHEEATLRFAIGKYYDNVADFARAFRSYKRANELHKMAAHPYDRTQLTQFVDDMTRLYTHQSLAGEQAGSSSSVRPVLVVGMMRSGTSLIEQIIASHPAAAGAGELPFWNDALRKRRPDVQRELLSEQARRQLSEDYLRILARHSSDALRVVDKSTFNSNHLGIIHSVFPKARMIYVLRDPIDACLSSYFQWFSTALNFTMDLSDLAHYYREHHRLVTHWRAVLPTETLLVVPYSEMVSDQEKWSRKIIDFIGLEWDPRCLEFEKTDRTVLTASQWQVRQKIYKSSVGRWRNYEKFIGPLLSLKDLQA